MLPLGRRRHDDSAVPTAHHGRYERAENIACTGQVVVDRNVPIRILDLEQRMKLLNAGVGEQDVDWAEAVLNSFGSIAQCSSVTLVERDRLPLDTESLHLFAGPVQVLWSGRYYSRSKID